MDLEEGLGIIAHTLCLQETSYKGFCASSFDFETIFNVQFVFINQYWKLQRETTGKGLLLETVYIDDSKKR